MKHPHEHTFPLRNIDCQSILSAMSDAVTVYASDLHIIYQNPASLQFQGSNCHTDCGNSSPPPAASFKDGATHTFERTIAIKDTQHSVEIRTSPLMDKNGQICAVVECLRDISSHKQTENRLTRYMNMYAALSHTNKAIMESASRQEMFDRVCAAAVEFGKFRLTVIGFIDENRTIQPVAHCGVASRYLDSLVVHTDANLERGRGPTGKAIQSGTPYICNDFHNDPITNPWRVAAKENGIFASATFPLKLQGTVVGALKIYSDQTGYFDEEIITLLKELAANISFGLDNFYNEEQRRYSEKALSNSEKQLKLVLEGSNDGFIDWHIPSATLQMSTRYLEMLGYTQDELEPKPLSIKKLVHPEDWPHVEKLLDKELVKRNPSFEISARMLAKSGEWRWILYRGKVVEKNESGMTTRVAGTCTDISEKKMYEEQLWYSSTHDQLTGLYNRAYFDAELARIRVGRNFPVSIVIADVDELKQVNDTLGHPEGDRLLQLAALALREPFRADDVVARIGGDEFAIILPNTDADAIKQSIKRILAFQAHINSKRDNTALSISIGSATAHSSDQLNDALKQADSQMYHYKMTRKTSCFATTSQNTPYSIPTYQISTSD